MKIVGFSEINGTIQMVLKCDSSLLVNRKPFFIPDWSNDVRMTPCVALRVSRLGKNIGVQFATRYYDAVAPAINIVAADVVAQGNWAQGWAFDYSLPMGNFVELNRNPWNDTIISFDEAIHRASEVMTIRQGDLIFIDRKIPSRALQHEEIIIESIDNEELLYCKVK